MTAMAKTSRIMNLNPLTMLIIAAIYGAGCSELPFSKGSIRNSASSDQSPGGPTGGPGGPSSEAEQAIPASVPGENPGNQDRDPSVQPLASLASAKLEQRLATGLQLNRRKMCRELGSSPCFGKVFSPALGNKAPQSRLSASTSPSALAPVAIERIARQVCRMRRQEDTALGDNAQVFKFFDLGPTEPSHAAVADQTIDLYHRLLARAPTPEELAATRIVLGRGLSGGDVAETLCFAIAGSMEIFFN